MVGGRPHRARDVAAAGRVKTSRWSDAEHTAIDVSEVLRLLIHAILEHRHNKLSDDATILMFEWQPPDP